MPFPSSPRCCSKSNYDMVGFGFFGLPPRRKPPKLLHKRQKLGTQKLECDRHGVPTVAVFLEQVDSDCGSGYTAGSRVLSLQYRWGHFCNRVCSCDKFAHTFKIRG